MIDHFSHTLISFNVTYINGALAGSGAGVDVICIVDRWK